MYYTNNGSYTVFVNFAPPPAPRCNACNALNPTRRTPDGLKWCGRCLTAQCAPDLFDLLFSAASPESRARLYRSLAAVFHPDQGGDERIMQAINVIKERYP